MFNNKNQETSSSKYQNILRSKPTNNLSSPEVRLIPSSNSFFKQCFIKHYSYFFNKSLKIYHDEDRCSGDDDGCHMIYLHSSSDGKSLKIVDVISRKCSMVNLGVESWADEEQFGRFFSNLNGTLFPNHISIRNVEQISFDNTNPDQEGEKLYVYFSSKCLLKVESLE